MSLEVCCLPHERYTAHLLRGDLHTSIGGVLLASTEVTCSPLY